MTNNQFAAIIWSKELAYVVGLIVTDGNLSIDGRHISFTSKDLQLARLYKKYLNLNVKIGKKSSGSQKEKKYFVVQFGSIHFYHFLESIGLTAHKSKTIGKLSIPENFFYDFLRGCIDGDGSIGAFMHPESHLPQLRVRLVSASKVFLEWINEVITHAGIKGYFVKGDGVTTLAFAKRDSTKLLHLVYYPGFLESLNRKYQLAKKYADVV